MFVDSSPVPTRRSTDARRVRGGCGEAAARPRVTTAARRTRLADAIVSQWLLEQVPAEHRHALARRGEVAV
jgi:hypothetical protein